MQYILNETEMQEFLTLKEENVKLSKALSELEKISARRLDTISRLSDRVRNLSERGVCIAKSPYAKLFRLISVDRADAYRKMGWTVSKECPVDCLSH